MLGAGGGGGMVWGEGDGGGVGGGGGWQGYCVHCVHLNPLSSEVIVSIVYTSLLLSSLLAFPFPPFCRIFRKSHVLKSLPKGIP